MKDSFYPQLLKENKKENRMDNEVINQNVLV